METLDALETSRRVWRWHEVWIETVTNPSVQTFRNILEDPTARPNRAYTWIAVLVFVLGIVEVLIWQSLGAGASKNNLYGLAGTPLSLLICIPLVMVVGGVLGTIIYVAILNAIARILGGYGGYDKLVYCFAAWEAPVFILSSLTSLIYDVIAAAETETSLIVVCLLAFSLALVIYSMVLSVMAIMAVESVSAGKAIATVLIPEGVLLLLGIFGVARF